MWQEAMAKEVSVHLSIRCWWNIQERRSNENKVRSQRFMEALDVDEMIAHLLIAEGFSTVDEIALVDLSAESGRVWRSKIFRAGIPDLRQ